MRKMMSKEVTQTTVKVGKVVIGDNGMPSIEPLPDLILVGNVSQAKAQKTVVEKYKTLVNAGVTVTVFGIEANTVVYEMEVEKFIELATVKVEETEEEAVESEASEKEEAAKTQEKASA
jgi:hypothetical protein